MPRGVFPTHVGMFRDMPVNRSGSGCFPHTCGDVPRTMARMVRPQRFSPHMWGCSERQARTRRLHRVFPTHVGMFRSDIGSHLENAGFPHTCGDVPWTQVTIATAQQFSPHMWGCSGGMTGNGEFVFVFPTHVGMFRR